MKRDPVDVITDPLMPHRRALLVIDDDGGQPCGDALAPALLVERGGHAQLAAEVYRPRHADRIVQAWRHFTDHDLFTRYLRLCHGTTTVATAGGRDTTVLTFDTTDYRALTGITGAADLSGERCEWQAWLDGEVYGVIIERRTAGSNCVQCGHRVMPGWAEVESCWGFYGHADATEQARQLLRTTTSR